MLQPIRRVHIIVRCSVASHCPAPAKNCSKLSVVCGCDLCIFTYGISQMSDSIKITVFRIDYSFKSYCCCHFVEFKCFCYFINNVVLYNIKRQKVNLLRILNDYEKSNGSFSDHIVNLNCIVVT